jgi:hypothetical protein
MPRKSQRDPGAAYQRKAAAARRFPVGSRCECGEARPEALIPGTDPLICAECNRIKQGKSAFDKHHPAGRANSRVTIPVPANDHRAELSTAQYDWPKRTLENSEGSPLLAGAASIRGFVDTTSYLVEKFLVPLAEFLEKLDAFLAEKLGAMWWKRTELEHFRPGS